MAADPTPERPPVAPGPAGNGAADGPVPGALLPLVRLGGRLYVLPGCLHFVPPDRATLPGCSMPRPAEPFAPEGP
jgi:hypothetical protein